MEENKLGVKRVHNPKEQANIEKITFPFFNDSELQTLQKRGTNVEHHVLPGKFTWIQGFIYPYKGLPHDFAVQALASVKKIIPAVTEYLLTKKLAIVMGFYLCFFRKSFKKMVRKIIDMFLYATFRPIYQYRTAPHNYCRAVRELYRVFNILIDREMPLDSELRGRWIRLRDFICIALEYDNAYRYRLQDVLSELKLDEIKLDDGDKYFCATRSDYDIEGKSLRQRRDELNKFIKGYMEADNNQVNAAAEEKLRVIVPAFQKELSKLLEKHGVFLEPFIAYTENGMSPGIRVKPQPESEKTEREKQIIEEVKKLERENELIALEKENKKREGLVEDKVEDTTTHK